MPVGLALHVVSGEDVELGGQWRPRHRWTANDLTFTTIPLAASSVGIETLYEAIRNYRTASAFTGGSPRTVQDLRVHVMCLEGCSLNHAQPMHCQAADGQTRRSGRDGRWFFAKMQRTLRRG